jgi:hypothetical protein
VFYRYMEEDVVIEKWGCSFCNFSNIGRNRMRVHNPIAWSSEAGQLMVCSFCLFQAKNVTVFEHFKLELDFAI